VYRRDFRNRAAQSGERHFPVIVGISGRVPTKRWQELTRPRLSLLTKRNRPLLLTIGIRLCQPHSLAMAPKMSWRRLLSLHRL
jgi:hypothetical protein